ncbi:MAG TPA: arginine--tRNA ligase [Myxococcaceae bacterium]|nr:arginine--tRNA ligase [Myxococcaceae bacterium]
MSVHDQLTRAFADALARALALGVEDVLQAVKPAEAEHGDLTFPTFSLARTLKKAPPAIAAELAGRVTVAGMTLAAAGPYLNARFDALPFSAEVLAEIRTAGPSYASDHSGAGKTVVIDYSSPNIAKPIAYHHIRTTVLGHALANLYRHAGWRVEGINYLGDWGKQFGLVAVGFGAFGDPARKGDMAHLVDVYVRANARAEQDPAFDAEARALFRRMEEGDPEALRVWKDFRDASLAGFEPIYARLGIRFEHVEGESRYQGRMEKVIEEIARTVGVRESEGALVVDLPYGENEPPVLLKKSDGSTLYVTRDLAAAEDRWERFHFDRSLYVVARDQSLHFAQVFRVLKAMGKPWADRCLHVAFGRIAGMATRKGQLVMLTDVLDEAHARALDKVQENVAGGRIHTDEPDTLAEQVGLGAIVFADLRNRRNTDYTFDWEEVLAFEGHTGPYLQYAHARSCSLLVRGGGAPGPVDASVLTLPEEQALVRSLALFPRAVRSAVEADEPSFVATHLLEVAAAFSRWYTLGNQDRSKRVLVDDDPRLRDARLALADAVRITLRTGLTLLGIPAPENM